MISVIICHRNKEHLKVVSHNIMHTIGVAYELVIVDNTNNQHSIFSAYNEGVERSRYSICCFTHEDVLFDRDGWGANVLKHFEDAEVGMIGVLGSMAIPVTPCAWWYNFHYGFCAVSLLEDRTPEAPKELIVSKGRRYYYLNPFQDKKTEVVMVDGLWFCIRRSLFQNIRFDERFSGFHLYDADISMQVRAYAKIYVVYDVLLQHFSRGPTQQDYYRSLLLLTKKWRSKLPQTTNGITAQMVNKLTWYGLRRTLLDMQATEFNTKEIKEVVNEYLPMVNYKVGASHRVYFSLSDLLGYKIVNALYERLEKLAPLPAAKKIKELPSGISKIGEQEVGS